MHLLGVVAVLPLVALDPALIVLLYDAARSARHGGKCGRPDASSLDWLIKAGSDELHRRVLQMAELVRTNDPGIISVVEGLLGGADVPYQVTDRNMSILEGSISAIQVRILVPDERAEEARQLLVEADLGDWLRP